MKYTEMPDKDFRVMRTVEANGPLEFIEFLGGVPAETPVAWYSHKDEMAHPGVWVKRGTYRLKHGTFVDPSDLSAYAAQYYELASDGRHEAVQIGRSPYGISLPEDVVPAATAEEFACAIRRLIPEIAWDGEAMPEVTDVSEAREGQRSEASPTIVAEASPTVEAEGLCGLKLLQPDYAFEFHGALTRGWHAQLYIAGGEGDEEATELIVLR